MSIAVTPGDISAVKDLGIDLPEMIGEFKQDSVSCNNWVSQGVFDIKASNNAGVFVASSWQMPENVSSAVQKGMSALNGGTKGKYAWTWFLIPVVTIISYIISKL